MLGKILSFVVALHLWPDFQSRLIVTAAGISILRPGPSLKEWARNTNFENIDNWLGLQGHENCTENIYEFPAWYRESLVATLPPQFPGKQIILPTNGHFVFREGVTTFLSPAQQQSGSCRGREVKFARTSRANWHDPDNWKYRNFVVNGKFGSDTEVGVTFEAVPHVERVPCQYDAVRFPGESTFHLKIEENVTIANFLMDKKNLSYTDVAILMNSVLGKLQFRKDPETQFLITMSNDSHLSHAPSKARQCAGSNQDIVDSDQCICVNYADRNLKQKICSLADCPGGGTVEELCPNPLTPHGFCCPICGFHIKIRHSGNIRLVPLHQKLKSEIGKVQMDGQVQVHLSRYQPRFAHLLILPTNYTSGDSELLQRIGSLVLRFQGILRNEESEVIGITTMDAWGSLLPSGASIWSGGTPDRYEDAGMGGAAITLIIFLCIVFLLVGIALFIFLWNKQHSTTPLTFSSVTNAFSRMPSMRIPIVSEIGARRRSSTLSNSLHSFGFARFSSERGSSVTIGQSEEAEAGAVGEEEKVGKKKSSTIRRAQQVDDEPLPVTAEETVSGANSGQFGFGSVSYDLVAGVAEEGEKPPQPCKVVPTPLLTIPEVVVVDMDDEGSGGNLIPEPPPKPERVKEEVASTAKESLGKKLLKPGFIASKLAGTYKKMGQELEEEEVENAGQLEKKEIAEQKIVSESIEEKPNIAVEEELASSSKEKSLGKKLLKPGFIASKLAGTYKKMGQELDEEGDEEQPGQLETQQVDQEKFDFSDFEDVPIVAVEETPASHDEEGSDEPVTITEGGVPEAKIIDF